MAVTKRTLCLKKRRGPQGWWAFSLASDVVVEVPKYQAMIFSKETKLNYARRFAGRSPSPKPQTGNAQQCSRHKGLMRHTAAR
jgi:hypothetical protein